MRHIASVLIGWAALLLCLLSPVHPTSDTSPLLLQQTSNMQQRYTFNLFNHYLIDDSLDNVKQPARAMMPIPSVDGRMTAYRLLENRPHVQVDHATLHHIIKILQETSEFSILTAVKIESESKSTILSLVAHNKKKLLEVDYSTKKQELRLHYLHSNRSHSETFPVPLLADKLWHKLAITVTHNFVQLFLDCQLIFERQIPRMDIFTKSHNSELFEKARMWIAQSGPRSRGQLEGVMEYIKLVMYNNGYTEQCPNANVACPTCSQFHGLEQLVHNLYAHIEDLHKTIAAAESRIEALEQCECMSSCHVEDTHFRDGESWQKDHCTTCTCRGGDVSCEEPKCPELYCKHPVTEEGACCPHCLRECSHNGIDYENGEVVSVVGCTMHRCEDGVVLRVKMEEECPKLDCSPEVQVSIHGECCKVCKGPHDDPNATCITVGGQLTCSCNEGYTGNGLTCTDHDECASEGDAEGHYCLEHSDCVNLPGSYKCECHQGFVSIDQYTCEDVDECANDPDICGFRAQCINTVGSFRCQCAVGFSGTPDNCSPVCTVPCENGGECIAPDTCRCQPGFTGTRCEEDIDECESPTSRCHANSECVNLHGSYTCRCREGFYSIHPTNQQGSLCVDINECDLPADPTRSPLCPRGTECINTVGGFQCECTDSDSCNTGCNYNGRFYENGKTWTRANDQCTQCTCEEGNVSCRVATASTCDCQSSEVDLKCCPQCRHHAKKCRHQEKPLSYFSGVKWTYKCQTCVCIDGETECSPMQCPALTCSPTVHQEGECCPRCAQNDTCDAVTLSSPSRESGSMCYFYGQHYADQKSWRLMWNDCITCRCQGGQVCCQSEAGCTSARAKQFSQLWRSDWADAGTRNKRRSRKRRNRDKRRRGAANRSHQ